MKYNLQAIMMRRKYVGPRKNIICNGNLKSDFYIQANVAKMEGAADFTGVIIQSVYQDPTGRAFLLNHISLPYAIPYELLKPSESIISTTNFKKFRSNFIRINVADPGKVWLFDDKQKDTFIHNCRMSARLAYKSGVLGLFMDNEAYSGSNFWRFTSQLIDHPSNLTFDDYKAQYYQVGKSVGQAYTEEYKEITLMLAISFEQLRSIKPDFLPYDKYGLLPSFLNGLYDGMGTTTTIINSLEDGYANRVQADLDYDLKIQVDAAVPYLTSKNYNAIHVPGMSTWCDYPGKNFDFTDTAKNYFTPQLFESVLDMNLAHVDWVVSYSEQINWQDPKPGINAPPTAYLAAQTRIAKKYGVV